MGTDLEQYVHPDRISSQLICPICTQVLKNPVQTSTDHLFCEDELLEWMARSNLCPVSKQVLDPEKITKPSRIILNMLAELEIYCTNKCEGCTWSGSYEHLQKHLANCTFRPRSELYVEIKMLSDRIVHLESIYSQLESRHDHVIEENGYLKDLVEEYRQRLRIFHALLPSESRPACAFEGDESFVEGESELYTDDAKDSSYVSDRSHSDTQTDVDRLRKLRTLRSLNLDETDQKLRHDLHRK